MYWKKLFTTFTWTTYLRIIEIGEVYGSHLINAGLVVTGWLAFRNHYNIYICVFIYVPETCPDYWDRTRERKRSHFVVRNNGSPSIRGASWPENTGSSVDPWFLVRTIDRRVPRSDRKSLCARSVCIPRRIRSTRIAGTINEY